MINKTNFQTLITEQLKRGLSLSEDSQKALIKQFNFDEQHQSLVNQLKAKEQPVKLHFHGELTGEQLDDDELKQLLKKEEIPEYKNEQVYFVYLNEKLITVECDIDFTFKPELTGQAKVLQIKDTLKTVCQFTAHYSFDDQDVCSKVEKIIYASQDKAWQLYLEHNDLLRVYYNIFWFVYDYLPFAVALNDQKLNNYLKNEFLKEWVTCYEEFLEYYANDLTKSHADYRLMKDSSLEDYVKVIKHLTQSTSDSLIQWSVPRDALNKIVNAKSNEIIDRLLQTVHNKFIVRRVHSTVTTVRKSSEYEFAKLFFN